MPRSEFAAWQGFDLRYPSVQVQLAMIYDLLGQAINGDLRHRADMGGWLTDPGEHRRQQRREAAAFVAAAHQARKAAGNV
ncbi:MAG: hypothetical protein F4Z50_07720 [Gemmatimonadetes bacterium]|nr:hypothetical protein [Gemmatimonadota bacterium]MYD13977.1 hypothetical protein [Gemmatimonadota bacterium]